MFKKLRWTPRPYSLYDEYSPTINGKQVKNKEKVKIQWEDGTIEQVEMCRTFYGNDFGEPDILWNIKIVYKGTTFLVPLRGLKKVKFDSV